MLKKILSIFFILCLVFSLTVPCFATPTNLGYWSVDLYGFVNKRYSGSALQLRVNSSPYHLFYFRIESDPPDTTQDWQYYFDPSTCYVLSGTLYNITANNQYATGGIIKLNSSSYFRVMFTRSNGDYTPTCSFTCFDITDMGFTTVQEVNEFLSHYDFDGYYNTGHYNFVSTDYNHFLNFYSNVFGHTFDYFGELTSTYSFVFVFIAAVLAILVFIFLVVFMIKRFTGGKT